jgi:hypothetical protein
MPGRGGLVVVPALTVVVAEHLHAEGEAHQTRVELSCKARDTLAQQAHNHR